MLGNTREHSFIYLLPKMCGLGARKYFPKVKKAVPVKQMDEFIGFLSTACPVE